MHHSPNRPQSGPLWLCIWDDPYRREWVMGPNVELDRAWKRKHAVEIVERRCIRNGWGRPDSIQYGGYSAAEGALPAAVRGRKDPRPRFLASHALRLYAALGAAWPVRSHLADPMLRTVTDRQLLDFMANMGTALERLRSSSADDDAVMELRRERYRTVSDAIDAQLLAWSYRAKELNVQRRVNALRAEERTAEAQGRLDVDEIRDRRVVVEKAKDEARKMKMGWQRRARNLRRRQAHVAGCAELDVILDGSLPRMEEITEEYCGWLVSCGWSPDDAARMSSAWGRIAVPRL